MEDYEILTSLGGGSFADVYKAREKSTGDLVAIKVLKKKYSKWEDCLDLRECKSLKKLHEEVKGYQKGIDYIIKLKQIIFIKESGTLNFVFEYMEKDWYELMKFYAPKKWSEDQIRNIVYQSLLGLSFMHKYGFFHRDMKPENLLVMGEIVKIADFGLAREIRSVPPYTEYVSTRYYRAPECILKSSNYNSPVDIWALGCIMAEMYLHPQPLFFGNNEKEVLFRICSILGTPNYSSWPEGLQQAKKVDIKFPNCPETNLAEIIPQASKEAIDVMYQMLNWDPNKRATANALLQHSFFTNFPISGWITNTGNSSICFNDSAKKHGKRFSNNSKKNGNYNNSSKLDNVSNKDSLYSDKKDEDNFSSMLNDTEGFDKLISKLKNDKIKEEKENEHNQNINMYSREFSLNSSNNNNTIVKADISKNIQSNVNQNSWYSESFNTKPNIPYYSNNKNNQNSNTNSYSSGLNINNNNNNNTNNNNNYTSSPPMNTTKKEIEQDRDDILDKSPVPEKYHQNWDFDTNILLKPNCSNNPRKRSARRFLEETNKSNPIRLSNNTNKFQYNNNDFSNLNSLSSSPPMIKKPEFPSRRMGGGTNNNMMIGENIFDRKGNNNSNNILNTNNNINSSNNILFGIESRRAHGNLANKLSGNSSGCVNDWVI